MLCKHLSILYKNIKKTKTGYSMVWRWIWYLSHEWHKCYIQFQIIDFSVYDVFFGFWTCFFQILDTSCNTRREVTVACYFYTVNKNHFNLIFSQCKINSLFTRYNFYFMDKTQHFTAENVIKENTKLDVFCNNLTIYGDNFFVNIRP